MLMGRDYVPEAGRMNTRWSGAADGLGVDRIDIRTAAQRIGRAAERPCRAYISDGRGNVRIMATRDDRAARPARPAAGSTISTAPRASATGGRSAATTSLSRRGHRSRSRSMPRSTPPMCSRKLNGRFALYRVELDGSMATELVYANAQVDVDDVVRADRGARVIGVTFADERRRIVYFDPDYAGTGALARAAPSPICR